MLKSHKNSVTNKEKFQFKLNKKEIVLFWIPKNQEFPGMGGVAWWQLANDPALLATTFSLFSVY